MKKTKSNYGMGTFTWREDRQKWKYAKMIGKGLQRKRASVSAETQRKCIELMNEKERQYLIDSESLQRQDNSYNSPINVILGVGIQEWLRVFKFHIVKNTTYDLYVAELKIINRYGISNIPTKDITAEQLQKFFNELQKRYSNSAVHSIYNVMNQYLRYYYSDNQRQNPISFVSIKNNNSVLQEQQKGIYNSDKKKINCLSDTEILQLENEIIQTNENGTLYYRYGLMFLFILWTFMRTGEALALQWKDIDFTKKEVHIYKNAELVRQRTEDGNEAANNKKYHFVITTTKTESSTRTIPLNTKALTYIIMHKKQSKHTQDNDFVFVTRNGLHPYSHILNKALRNITTKLHITNITMHGLRHTGISYFIRHNVDLKIVSQLAGHASVSITQNVYYNILEEQQKNAIDEINKALQKDFQKSII